MDDSKMDVINSGVLFGEYRRHRTHSELDSTDWLTASVRDREEQNPTEKVGGRSYRLKPMWTDRWELVEMQASMKR